MRVLVTGCRGYIGSVLTPLLQAAGHDVVGLDRDYFADCLLGPAPPLFPCLDTDIRDVRLADLEGVGAIIHLAALSNDPLGDLDPALTEEINGWASVRLAEQARRAGVARFLFSSSCSTYGAAGEEYRSEESPLAPVTAYGQSKVLAETELKRLANGEFSPVFLRNATAYGVSPRLRLDLVVNDFVAAAFTTGRILIKSDGTPWRPLVHVNDICHAFLAVLASPREAVHNQVFNVGRTSENYRVSELAEIVRSYVPGCHIDYDPAGRPDSRCYRVCCDKIEGQVPGFQPQWTVPRGVEQLLAFFRETGLTPGEARGPRYCRLKTLLELQRRGCIDSQLRPCGRGG